MHVVSVTNPYDRIPRFLDRCLRHNVKYNSVSVVNTKMSYRYGRALGWQYIRGTVVFTLRVTRVTCT
jgi:hypothetical protein